MTGRNFKHLFQHIIHSVVLVAIKHLNADYATFYSKKKEKKKKTCKQAHIHDRQNEIYFITHSRHVCAVLGNHVNREVKLLIPTGIR